MRRLAHIMVLAAFVFSCGGEWYVLQCVAWITMLHDYAQVVPFAKAVNMTFSGQYPCAICKAIAEKKQSETGKICALEKYEKKFVPPIAVAPAPPDATTFQYAGFAALLQGRTEPPPTPPPRLALA